MADHLAIKLGMVRNMATLRLLCTNHHLLHIELGAKVPCPSLTLRLSVN